jgi:hypothetical protein
VVRLNGVDITSVGTQSNGAGLMQFQDPGRNKPYNFQFKAGNVSFTDTVALRPGRNILKVFVNNIGRGIDGGIAPVGAAIRRLLDCAPTSHTRHKAIM